jgi:hypothetical protein
VLDTFDGLVPAVARVGVAAQVQPPGMYDPLTPHEIDRARATLLRDPRMAAAPGYGPHPA